MPRLSFLSIFILFSLSSPAQEKLLTPYEKGNGNTTATYEETIKYYHEIANKYPEAKLVPYGKSDHGEPIHLLILDKSKDFEPAKAHSKNKTVFFINNGIHPGEPEGIDASMMLARDLLTDKDLNALLDYMVICIVPIYNIGGALNRSGTSRANQNGPEEYGFRGNAQNLDLNRDFIKCDSKNALTFTKMFRLWQPHVFIDNHTSNGADYPYVMTLIHTQKDKLQSSLSEYMIQKMVPKLYESMAEKGSPMIPYVHSIKQTPESGIMGFLETPRYSTGYTTLFNTIGFTAETHMLKPFKQRVDATYMLMESIIRYMDANRMELIALKKKADIEVREQVEFPLRWELDTSKVDSLLFTGYTAKYKKSDISGQDRLYYDTKDPWTAKVPYLDSYQASLSITKPDGYIIPQAYKKVFERLQFNHIRPNILLKDTLMTVEVYYIEDVQTIPKVWEGHHLHKSVQVRKDTMKIQLKKGDHIIPTDQESNRYIVETLEPQAHDSFFAWNFFDAILGQKEWYSSYVFEDLAAEYLKKNKELKKQLDAKKESDLEFAENRNAQLHFIYINSPWYEKSTKNRYPVYRLINGLK